MHEKYKLLYQFMFKTAEYTFRGHVDLTVLSIFQKAATFNHNLTPYTSFFNLFFKYFFVGIYVLNEKV